MINNVTHTEKNLILGLRKGDEEAYSYLYDHYSSALYGIILRVVRKEEEAQDILQEVFVKIYEKIGNYDDTKGRLYTWMLQIARNSAIDRVRSKDFKSTSKIQSLDNDVNHSNIPSTEIPAVDHIGLKKVLNTLDKPHRIIIDMAYFKGYTQSEIAKELSMPLGTVKTRVRNALIQLRKVLNNNRRSK